MLSWNIPDSSERGAQSITSDNQAAENHWQLPVVDLWLAGPCPVIRLKWIKSLAVPNAAILHGLCSAAINWQRSATMQNRRKFNRWHCTAMERGGQWCIGLLKIVGSSPPRKIGHRCKWNGYCFLHSPTLSPQPSTSFLELWKSNPKS